ncbi:RHS repeat domain-containing protein [Labilibacter marinus]|uniref:RHS repeat domain-containing protein n=1 Tax=Labilibacter marinus TaxID=1477105 RepID=UPI00082D8F18|nr:RHS repeat-associated core domain-containing protein [Labilibacter marinus]
MLKNHLGSSYQLNKYLYNGKELQANEFEGASLDWYDYGARFYDASLGRWHCIDPLCEYSFKMTPYHYVTNNPMNYIDPFGLKETKTKKPKKERKHWWQFWRKKPYKVKGPWMPVYRIGGDATVVAKNKSKTKSKKSSYINWAYLLDAEGKGYYRPTPYRVREATWLEHWLANTFDQAEIKNFVDASGAWGPLPMEQENFLSGLHKEPKKGSDEYIVKTKTGKGKKVDTSGGKTNIKKQEETKVIVDTLYISKDGYKTTNPGYEHVKKKVLYRTSGSKDVDSSYYIQKK